ncbi:MAG: xanthine dehydrogenase family protein molybdopterin-binding subunit [Chloroflexota bacterium]|nr:xanthine dehydrogenase family protein molybdopterin-binding subunit [Chloroflexota bacterium]
MTYLGQRLRRVEDPRLLRGAGQYVDDLRFPGMLYAGFVRSPHPSARITSIDDSAALLVLEVAAVHTATNLPEVARPVPAVAMPPALQARGFSPLASDIVRYVGEPVAVVLANNREALADALDLVVVDYEPLDPVGTVEQALEGATLVWPDVAGNVALELSTGFGDVDAVLAEAEIMVEERYTFARAAGAAMEPRAVAAAPGGEEGIRLTLWDATQAPHNVRDGIATYLGLEPEELRVVTPDVGGGFGPRGRIYAEEYVVAALALHHQCPISFTATRTEDLLTTAQGGGLIIEARLAATREGVILGIDHHIVQDAGAYTAGGLSAPMNTMRHLLGPYRVPAARIQLTGVYTNRVMTSPLRGGGRQNGIFVVERLLDRLAERLQVDRAEIRRRNFIPPQAFPYDTGLPSTGGASMVYDSGSFPTYLDRALDMIDQASYLREQEGARQQGRYLGLGLAAFIEATGVGGEEAQLRLEPDGTVAVRVGSPSQGQGHATAFSQMAADRLGVSFDSVHYLSGDTAQVATGTGTFASRMGQTGGNAVGQAARELRERVLSLAADMLEIAAGDLDLVNDRIAVKGVPERVLLLREVAQEADRRGTPLQSRVEYQPAGGSTWAGGVNAAIVEVDAETGQVTILRYVVVHDCGTVINPTIVEGQVHGGVVHGIGNALLEECADDGQGHPANPTFVDYLLPSIGDVPMLETADVETPSPFNPEGIKGAGEGGTIGAIPTIVSAVEDALRPFGISLNQVPLQRAEIALRIAGSTR